MHADKITWKNLGRRAVFNGHGDKKTFSEKE